MKKSIQRNVGKWISFSFPLGSRTGSKALLLSYDPKTGKARLRRFLMDGTWKVDTWHESCLQHVRPLTNSASQYLDRQAADNIRSILLGLSREIGRDTVLVEEIESGQFEADRAYLGIIRDRYFDQTKWCFRHERRVEAEAFFDLYKRVMVLQGKKGTI